ncbi:YceI family protein [Chitinophaga lutea]
MKHLLFTVMLLTGLSCLAQGQQTVWKADPEKSSVGFSVNHLMITKVEGRFKKFTATIQAAGQDFSNAAVTAEIEVPSITTGDEKRDNHLKSDDFFNAEKYPALTFSSTSMTRVTNGKYLLEGMLTIRDVSKKVRLNAAFGGIVKGADNRNRAVFNVNTYLNRFDYNLKWDKLTEAGGMVVDKMVNISLRLEFVQQ